MTNVAKTVSESNYKFQGSGYETNAFDENYTSYPVIIPTEAGLAKDFEIVTMDGKTTIVLGTELDKHYQRIKQIKSANSTALLTEFYLVK